MAALSIAVAFIAILAAQAQTQAAYPPTYENAAQCAGIVGRIAATSGDAEAVVELRQMTAELTAASQRLGAERAIPAQQVRADLDRNAASAALLIPTTSQAAWSEAMNNILPVALQCSALNDVLKAPATAAKPPAAKK